jgi:zona occludens toxin
MAIHLITGTPGAGKTLYTLVLVEKLREESGRDVYYQGIADLKLPWIEFENQTEWHKLPDKSIIVMDEAQRAFRPRAAVMKVPEHVEALETHRHRGIDIFIITQHPTLIEVNVRRLVESHRHIMRKFGSKWATVHEWKGTKDNCDKSRADSMRSEWRYPKEAFTWYKSAEAHTHKFKLPGKVMVLIAIPFIIAAGAWYLSTKLANWGKPPAALDNPPQAQQQSQLGQPSKSGISSAEPYSLQAYLDQYKQRLSGLPWTASRYDELTKPQRVPVIRGCWITDTPLEGFDHRAVCMLDGGVYVYPPESFVKQFLRDRFFIDWENPRAGDLAAASPRQGDIATAGRPATLPVSLP